MKEKRLFIEPLTDSDSYMRIAIDSDTGEVSLKLADCDRRIWWYFGKPGSKRAMRKIKAVKATIDEVHAHLTKMEAA
jgi:hypothetical protein